MTLNLEKLDQYVHIRGTGLEELEAEWKASDDEDMDSDSEDEEDDESEDDGEDVEIEEEEEDLEEREKRHAALSQAEKVRGPASSRQSVLM